MSFFNTKEFKTLSAIKDRLKQKRTLKNASLYEIYKMKCCSICKKEYGDIGHEDNGYMWLRRLEGMPMAKMEFSQDEFTNLWYRFWPENGDLDIDGLEQAVRAL